MLPTSPTSRLHGLAPADAAHVVAAATALEAGRAQEAEQQLRQITAAHHQHPEVLRLQAGTLGMRGQRDEAIRVMRQALAQRPQDALYHNTLGSLLGEASHYDEAIAALRQCCTLQPDLALAWYNLGMMLTRSVRNDEAVVALQRTIALTPDHSAARALLADLLRTTGQIDQAAAEYRRLLAEQPATGMAWWGLADLRAGLLGKDDIGRMQTVLRDGKAGIDDLIATGFALAKALDSAGRPAEALAALEQANALARRRQRWDARAFSGDVDAILASFTPPPQSASAIPLGRELIFIVSLPRSGSTLVEQILASHTAVEGAGELADLPQVLGEESRRRGMPFPQWVDQMQATDWERLGHRYLERTVHWRRQRPISLDKLPNNWMYIGAIRAMLPAARIVACRRDPLETCFSCYRQHLAGNEYTRSFGDLAGFWHDFDRSVRHWHKLHPAQVFEHVHEELLADPEGHIRRLLDFCDLQFEPACLHFHENRREVRSPSATQVRQPLHDTAHARRYGALLDPLRTALGLPPWQAPLPDHTA